jgi:asparagine synthase (glutamine-hydrolysing)
MTHGLARNRTAMAGVRRLAAGHRLVFTPGTGAQEVEDYAPAPRHELRDVPRQQVLSRLDAALDRATARMCSPYPEIGMFLSGGLDSRLLLGYGLRTGLLGKTVTFGEPNDQEYRVAARVARELGLNHRRIAHRDADFAEAARLEAADALLSNGFSSLHQWSIALQRPQLPPACITGLVGDAVLSMSHVAWGKEPETDGEAISLDRFVRTLNRRWGVPHDLLSKLSRSPFREVVQSTWEALPETLGARDGSAAYRIWTADLFNRQRCHVGSVAWRLSFITWPVMPVNDRQVVDMVASIPFSLIDQRFVQTQLVIREFPRLARLPLDRNRYDTAPLQPGIRDHLVQGVAWRLANTSLGRWWRLLRPERRYYHRLYDMDAPGWQAIREAAEPHRDCLSPLFHIDRLTEAYLPAPSRKIEMGNVISEGAGRKLLLGLMLLGAELPELLGA